jgi:hypothetical protein
LIIADRDLALFDEVSRRKDFGGGFSFAPSMVQRHQLLFSLMMWHYRNRSRTFLFRWMRLANWGMVRTGAGTIPFVASFSKWLLAGLRNQDAVLPPLLGNRFVFPFSSALIKSRLAINSELRDLVVSHKPDLIVFPSAAFEAAGIDAIRLGRELGIPTLSLIDNWDNLTSKTVYWIKPDRIGVWGEQAREQAVSIHRFDHAQVHLMGTPRFEQYFAARALKPETKGQKPYMLFVGSAMPFDELGALHALETHLEQEKIAPQDLRIVYRPHPWQQKRKTPSLFRSEDFLYTDLDPQIAAAYASGVKPETTDRSFQPDLSYYPNLLRNARIVVGPLTTMLFEAVLCLRPVVALAYSDGSHYTTTRRYFSHFDGLEQVPGFTFCEESAQLGNLVHRALGAPEISALESDQASRYFLHHDELAYPERLGRLVKSLAGSTKERTEDV